ncbi:hypothetical protein AB0K00_17150 [Dactylosporangium sp. NPDC049525]|uniref:hypothetical protein n=1 Tax=Dactylosporangium sp. NPDC049525 TaxID=3154730 RepID=UPI00341E2AAC
MGTMAGTLPSVVVFAAGAVTVLATAISAVQTLVVPRATPMLLTRWVFRGVRVPFHLRYRYAKDYVEQERAMALYGPLGLISLAVAWLLLIGSGYVLMYWALGVRPVRHAVVLSGSSMFTLGFVVPKDLPSTVLAFTQAAFGIGVIAMLISYLPSTYASFSRREAAVAGLDIRAGSPPSPAELLIRYTRIDGLDRLDEVWRTWQSWFTDIEETHTSLPAIAYFRSPDPRRSWVTAAGAVLDAASITASTLDQERSTEAQLCIRAGYITLRKIAGVFGIGFDPDPQWPGQQISVAKHEFDEVYDELAGEGVPVKTDREQAWRDFAGWRVNYDAVLLALAAFTFAPPAKWSSDRSPEVPLLPLLPPLTRRRNPPRR